MFVPKFVTLYGVLLIAATDAFPGMIPNSARQDIPISETPIRLTSVSGGATSLPATNTASLPVRPDPSTPVASVSSLSSLSTPATTDQPENAGPTVSMPDGPMMMHDTTRIIQTPETTAESPAKTVSLPPGGLSTTA